MSNSHATLTPKCGLCSAELFYEYTLTDLSLNICREHPISLSYFNINTQMIFLRLDTEYTT